MNPTLLFATIPIGLCSIFFAVSHHVNKTADKDRPSANSLVVLSGVLTALAILVPLGAQLLADSKGYGWASWFLVGALFSGAVCLFGTVYCMIGIQGEVTFIPKEKLFVPGWTNATWIALGMLALAAILLKLFPSTARVESELHGATRARFAVARDLPPLGSSHEMIETGWGTPTLAKAQELRYLTTDGTIIFCLDTKGVVRSITETQEGDANAIARVCAQN